MQFPKITVLDTTPDPWYQKYRNSCRDNGIEYLATTKENEIDTLLGSNQPIDIILIPFYVANTSEFKQRCIDYRKRQAGIKVVGTTLFYKSDVAELLEQLGADGYLNRTMPTHFADIMGRVLVGDKKFITRKPK